MDKKATVLRLLITTVLLSTFTIQQCSSQKLALNLGRKIVDQTSSSSSSTGSDTKKKRSYSFFNFADAASTADKDEEDNENEQKRGGEYIGLLFAGVFSVLAFVMNGRSTKNREKELMQNTEKKNVLEFLSDSSAMSISVVRIATTTTTTNKKNGEEKENKSDTNDDDDLSTDDYDNDNVDAPFDEDEAKQIKVDDDDNLSDKYRHDCEVGFENIKVTLSQGKKKEDRIILDGSLTGKARPGRMLAIMGPSGSGKSTLLHSIAGKIKKDAKISVYGKRYVNNEALTQDSTLPVAFVSQEINFFPHMTVKETLDFRVELKLGSKLGKSARDDVVTGLIDLMGLSKSADTIVGNAKIRGLSGGERKRLSIACEMISSPPVIFLDEPTSGLDSYQATQVTKFLRKLADNGKTIVSVIHQPSQHVFSMFDDLLLLSEGRLMYYGEVKQVRSYLGGIGYPCAKDVGTAEHALDCISRGTSSLPEQQAESDGRLNHLANEASKLTDELFSSVEVSNKAQHKLKFVTNGVGKRAAGIFHQFRLLLKRAFNEERRGKTTIILKLVQQVTMATIFGGIYNLSNNQASVMDRFGLISLLGTVTTNIALASAVRSFPKEKSMITTEMSSGMYKTLPYLFAKAMAELPLIGVYNGIFSAIIYPLSGLQKGKFSNFLAITSMHSFASNSLGLLVGAVSSNSDVALALMPPIIALSVIFDGRNVSEENTPFLLKWVPKVGLIRWFFEGLSVNEFTGLTFDTSGPRRGPIVKTGIDALERFGIAKRNLSDVFTAQTRIVAGCWVLSFLGLSLTKERFEEMHLPVS